MPAPNVPNGGLLNSTLKQGGALALFALIMLLGVGTGIAYVGKATCDALVPEATNYLRAAAELDKQNAKNVEQIAEAMTRATQEHSLLMAAITENQNGIEKRFSETSSEATLQRTEMLKATGLLAETLETRHQEHVAQEAILSQLLALIERATKQMEKVPGQREEALRIQIESLALLRKIEIAINKMSAEIREASGPDGEG